MNRAYAALTVKAVEEERRIIRGWATTPTADRVGDVIMPLGVEFKNPMPLLHQHNSAEPVGTVRFDKPTKDGITFEARLPKIDEPPSLKDRIDTAWAEIKAGLVRAVSIGFRPIDKEFEVMKDGGLRFLRTEVLELSLVTIPANQDALITEFKQFDTGLPADETNKAISTEERAALGHSAPRQAVRLIPPGGSGTSPKPKAKDTTMAKTLAEQIPALENTRAAKTARMDEVMQKSIDDGRSTNAEEREEFDTLKGEVEDIDGDLVRLRDLEKVNKAKAAPVNGKNAEEAGKSRGGDERPHIQVLHKKLEPGIRFARYVGAMAASRGNRWEAAEFAKRWRDTSPEIEKILKMPSDIIEKAAVDVGTTTDSDWAEPLVQYQNMAGEFIDYLRPLTIIGRITGFRMVPFKIKVPRQTGVSSVNWVGETKVKPVSSLAFDSVTFEHFKIAGIIAMSEELVRFSNPSAELLVRNDLAESITQLMDHDFVDPTKALQAGVSPASITNGVTAITASGTSSDAFRADAKGIFDALLAAGLQISGGVWIMTQGQAVALSMMLNPLGQPDFPGITALGGTLFGFPVITSQNMPATGGSPTDGYPIIFAMPGEIMLADDGGVNIDMSREASLQMDGAPDSPETASTVMVSLWQKNLIAIKAERFINWLKRRSGVVQYIQNAKYS